MLAESVYIILSSHIVHYYYK